MLKFKGRLEFFEEDQKKENEYQAINDVSEKEISIGYCNKFLFPLPPSHPCSDKNIENIVICKCVSKTSSESYELLVSVVFNFKLKADVNLC